MNTGTIIIHPTLGPVEVVREPTADVIGADGFEHHLGAAVLETCYPASLNEALRYWIARCHNAEGRDVPCDHDDTRKAEAVPEGLPKDIATPVAPRDLPPYWRNAASASPAAQAYRGVERASQGRLERHENRYAEPDQAVGTRPTRRDLETAAAEARAAAEHCGFGLVAAPAEIRVRKHGLLEALGVGGISIDTLGTPLDQLPLGRYVYAGE
jgi:hypothetical protein